MAHPAKPFGIGGLSLAILLTAFGALSLAQPGADGDRPPGPPPPPPPVAFVIRSQNFGASAGLYPAVAISSSPM